VIVGVGVDLAEVQRVADLLQKYSGRFAARVFTDGERAYCESMPNPSLHFAARFAAKEAFLKAIGTGLARGISWKEIDIQRLASGQPVLVLTGQAAEELKRLGATRAHVSLSHTQGHACAMVVVEGTGPATGTRTAAEGMP